MTLMTRRESIHASGFALATFWTAVISGGVLCLFPKLGLWCLLFALIPWGIKLAFGRLEFRPIGIDALLAVFLLSACAGLWAAYDPVKASTKFNLILASLLLFAAIRMQPEANLIWISTAFIFLGIGVSVYFFLTHDFIALPRKLEGVNTLGRWIMQVRPSLAWEPIHPNYVSGLAAMTLPFLAYPLWSIRGNENRGWMGVFLFAGLVLNASAILMTTSRGVVMAIATACGVLGIGKLVRVYRIKLRWGSNAVFPSLVLLLLAAVVTILYLGPASVGGAIADSGDFGNGSRGELFANSSYLLADFPFTGGGLGAFPGLYSQYQLGIPYYYLPNAHNLFLDVMIEQGIPGGLAFLFLYGIGLWQAAEKVGSEYSRVGVFHWIALACIVIAIVHGLVDDYLYNGSGTLLSMVPLAITALPDRRLPIEKGPFQAERQIALLAGFLILAIFITGIGKLKSAWLANLGAVQLSKIELKEFPTGQWAGSELIPALNSSQVSLLSSVEADRQNRTANHRLGLIFMLRQDFSSSVLYLENAHAQSPGHRGITKALGYCYVWLGDFAKAQILLKGIPESKNELVSYEWWWLIQGRNDLSERASIMHTLLLSDSNHPIVLP